MIVGNWGIFKRVGWMSSALLQPFCSPNATHVAELPTLVIVAYRRITEGSICSLPLGAFDSL